ncbi:hypothetical protein SDC9_132413 [bioreactor metagenome]|uniref:Anti-sigma-28 factor FlgM C-terminal domain-containing protein n=1 Tax=bioreactor metagenome TaxID=1076179 RepID=A0A645D804_9ZZZZ
MRIDRNQALKYYESAKNVSAVKSDNVAASTNGSNTDRISISSEAARQVELGSTVQNIASEVETSVSNARLQQLSAQIETGTYRVPTQQLAASILNYLG